MKLRKRWRGHEVKCMCDYTELSDDLLWEMFKKGKVDKYPTTGKYDNICPDCNCYYFYFEKASLDVIR